jgi:tungstate transport system substrate-binding protein
MSVWNEAGLDPEGQSWYEQSGQGMGATLQIANQKDAYTLSDRGTYLAQSKNLDLVVLAEGDPLLLNVYSVMQANPERFGLVNGPGGKAFVDFMVSESAQEIIRDFGVEEFGQPLFVPDADRSYEELGLE